jgi:hypothetical protein
LDIRKVEVNRNYEWIEIHFWQLHKRELFRMFEPTGEPVTDREGNTIFYSTSEPFKNEEGIWSIDTHQ